MKRAILTAAVCGLVLTIVGPAAAGPPSCTLTSPDGKVTVNLGGFNGDNAYGVVTDATGASVKGAKVDIYNRTKDEAGNDESGVRGGYDIDLDAETGDVVDVFVTWEVTTRTGTKKLQVQGTCTL